ncbi:MAG TPA: FumA C-terminus/TtdB family hydratase beta subunit [Symbiobacteriaceae bacterium]|jgi:fumarate hydratase subunit beta
MAKVYVTTPLTKEQIKNIKAGDEVIITGTIYTARDAAHKKMVDDLAAGKALPFDATGAIIYYTGPTPPKPGQALGSCGPTTSYRMDKYAPTMYEQGVGAAIGKGYRSDEVKAALVKNGALYLASTGGAGALLAKRVEAAEVVAYEELGAEAVRKLTVSELPTVCINDASGGDQYYNGQVQYVKADAMVKPKKPEAGE